MFQALLNVVNHSAQTSAAALFICCSYVSSYLGFRKGKDASIKGRETDHLVRGQAGKMHFCLPAWISARKTRSHKMISVSILKSMNNKWIHSFYRTGDKGGVTGVTPRRAQTLSLALFHPTKLWLFVCFAKHNHCIYDRKYFCFWKTAMIITVWSRLLMIRIVIYNRGNCFEKANAHMFIYIFLI